MPPSTRTDRHTQYITLSNGKLLCYATFGAESGVPLLYFHGWPSSRLQARSLDLIGKELGFTIYAPDRPGLGQSDHLENRSLLDWPGIVDGFLDTLPINGKAHLMGVSGGGPYAIATACELNHRIASTSIVCGAPPLAELPNRDEMILPYRALLKMRPILPKLIKPALPLTKWIASKSYEQAPLSWFVKTLSAADQKMFLEDETTVFALHSFREALVNDAPGIITDADAYALPWNLDFTKIKHPIHFWHGTEDQNIPFKMAQHLAAKIPQAVPHWLEGEGHYTVPMLYAQQILSQMKALSN